jgi:hypothetical protein
MATRWYWLGCVALSAGCSEAPPQRQASLPPPSVAPIAWDTASPVIDTNAASLDTALGQCSVALQAPSGEQQEVIGALKAAYGLEDALFQRGTLDSITREEVYHHYRQGFEERLAQQLADYSWEAEHLRPAERALTIPDSVGVLELKEDQAVVAWIPPTAFRAQWGGPRCVVDRLVREGGRWIVQARDR